MAIDREIFVAALEENQAAFNLSLSGNQKNALAGFYEIVSLWNARLHLVAPCSPAEFAVRHVLESLALLEHLPANTHLADIGAGAGLPSLPCLIAREDLRGNLIESNRKKVVFLREAATKLLVHHRTTVLSVRFEDLPPAEHGVVTSRALDKFTEKILEIAVWAKDAEKMILFGGASVRAELAKLALPFAEKLIPASEQRFLFVVSQPSINGA